MRPITGAELTLEGRLARHAAGRDAEGYANLCRLLTARARGTTAFESRRCRRWPLVAERADGLVCLSGCARHGLGRPRSERRRPARRRVRPRPLLRRAPAPVRARRRASQRARCASWPETLGVETVATGDVHSHSRRRAVLQDALVAIRHRATLDGSERERRGNRECVLRPPAEMADRFPDDRCRRRPHGRARRPARVRPDPGARLPLSRLRRRRGDGRRAAAPGLRARVRRALRRRERPQAASPRAPRGGAALIAYHGLSGFFLLHLEVLELAREIALEVRGPDSPPQRPAAGPRAAAPRSARSSATSPASRTSTPSRPASRSAASSTASSPPCPTSTSTSRATSASG